MKSWGSDSPVWVDLGLYFCSNHLLHGRRHLSQRHLSFELRSCFIQSFQYYFLTLLLVCVLSHVQLFETPWTVTRQAPLSMGFPRLEYWSELPSPSPGGLPNTSVKPASLVSPVLIGRRVLYCWATRKARMVGEVLKSEPVQVWESRIVFPPHWDRIWEDGIFLFFPSFFF